MKIYVGNLPYSLDDAGLRALFEPHAEVDDAFVLMIRETGQSRGFGFVTIPDDAQATAAIEALDGLALDGRSLKVNEARPPEERRNPFGGWHGNSGGGQRRGGRRGGGDHW